jgi:hypothetical protein
MSFSTLARNKNSERLIALLSAVAVLMSLMAIYAAPAKAHHPTTTAGVVCDGPDVAVSYTSTSWQNGSRHDDIRIQVSVNGGGWTEVASGAYNAGNGYTFSGTFDASPYVGESIRVRSWAEGTWFNGSAAGNGHPDATTAPFTVTDNCGPDDVSVTVGAGVCDVVQGQASGSIDVSITPASGATVNVYSDAGQTNLVGSLTETESIDDLPPGTYYWTAAANGNFQLTGPSSGQVTIADCEVTVSVEAGGVCTVDNSGAAVGSVEIVIDPTSGAVVTVYSDAAMTQEVLDTDASGTFDLAPGTYYWTADAADGFDIDGDSSGQFTIDPCEVSVDVSGECVLDGSLGTGVITVTISVDGGANVTVTDGGGAVVATLTESGAVNVPEGETYSWAANAAPGFAMSGDDSGSVEIEECTPPTEVGASILVTVEGTCEINDGLGQGEIEVTVSVTDGATVVITDSSGDVVGTFTSDGTLTVPEGATYTWEATPSEGFEFPPGFESSGSIAIDGCTPDEVLASIQVTVSGSCELDGDEGQGVVDITMSVPDGATVVVRDSDGDVVGALTDDGTLSVPEGATYTWVATPSEGFEFPPGFDSSGSFTIERCSDPETLPFTGFDPFQMGVFAILLMGAGVAAMYLAPREEGA